MTLNVKNTLSFSISRECATFTDNYIIRILFIYVFIWCTPQHKPYKNRTKLFKKDHACLSRHFFFQ